MSNLIDRVLRACGLRRIEQVQIGKEAVPLKTVVTAASTSEWSPAFPPIEKEAMPEAFELQQPGVNLNCRCGEINPIPKYNSSTKVCRRCKISRPRSWYDGSTHNGSVCEACRAADNLVHDFTCERCKTTKPLSEFYKYKNCRNDGTFSYTYDKKCRVCRRELTRSLDHIKKMANAIPIKDRRRIRLNVENGMFSPVDLAMRYQVAVSVVEYICHDMKEDVL